MSDAPTAEASVVPKSLSVEEKKEDVARRMSAMAGDDKTKAAMAFLSSVKDDDSDEDVYARSRTKRKSTTQLTKDNLGDESDDDDEDDGEKPTIAPTVASWPTLKPAIGKEGDKTLTPATANLKTWPSFSFNPSGATSFGTTGENKPQTFSFSNKSTPDGVKQATFSFAAATPSGFSLKSNTEMKFNFQNDVANTMQKASSLSSGANTKLFGKDIPAPEGGAFQLKSFTIPATFAQQEPKEKEGEAEAEENAEDKTVVVFGSSESSGTGEEGEETVFKAESKLFEFDTVKKEWKPRGVGPLKINVSKEDNTKSRLLMRNDTFRIILNAAIVKGITVKPVANKPKAISFSVKEEAVEGQEHKAVVFTAQFRTTNEADEAKAALEAAVAKKEEKKDDKEEKKEEEKKEEEKKEETPAEDTKEAKAE